MHACMHNYTAARHIHFIMYHVYITWQIDEIILHKRITVIVHTWYTHSVNNNNHAVAIRISLIPRPSHNGENLGMRLYTHNMKYSSDMQ